MRSVRSEHPRAPFEAQRAQSIVARTFALHAASEPRHPEAPLCATQHCQVYKGAIADDGELGPRAAHATAEMVLVDEADRDRAGLLPQHVRWPNTRRRVGVARAPVQNLSSASTTSTKRARRGAA